MIADTSLPAIRWRVADGSADACWTALVPAPGQNLGFSEKKRYVFEVPGPQWWFVIDDEPLEKVDPTRCFWEPGFFAGEVTAALLDAAGQTAGLFLLDVAPDASKLGRDTFQQMLDEIWAHDPELVIGSEPATAPIGHLGETENPWLAFSRLRRYGPEFIHALDAIRAKPRRVLRVQRDSALLHHVRRVDRRTALSLARSPAVALFLPEADAPPLSPETRLDVPFTEESLDSAANRAILALAVALLRRTRSIRHAIQQLVDRETPSDTRAPLRKRWPLRRKVLENLEAGLERALRRTPFTDVSRPEVTAAGLTAATADPIYARAWGRGWRALRHGLDDTGSTERLWVSPSWEIYERWCFVRLGKLLATTAADWSWRREGTRWIGTRAGRRTELRLQPTFSSCQHEAPGMWSVSKERVPDLVLTVESAEAIRFVVLDAKYRTSRANVLDAMSSAHIYQDSLRIGAQRPQASLLLVPAGGGALWLEDAGFHEVHRVGVHPFSFEGAAVPSLLRGFLKATT